MEYFCRKDYWLAPSKKPSLQITSSAIQTFQRQRTSDMSNPGCEILFPAEKKFWGSPELVEKRDKVIKKVLPEEEEFMPWGPNSTIFLAYMRPKMKLFCQILDTTEDSNKDLLEKELLHLLFWHQPNVPVLLHPWIE